MLRAGKEKVVEIEEEDCFSGFIRECQAKCGKHIGRGEHHCNILMLESKIRMYAILITLLLSICYMKILFSSILLLLIPPRQRILEQVCRQKNKQFVLNLSHHFNYTNLL